VFVVLLVFFGASVSPLPAKIDPPPPPEARAPAAAPARPAPQLKTSVYSMSASFMPA
jgi:hypothetical protein